MKRMFLILACMFCTLCLPAQQGQNTLKGILKSVKENAVLHKEHLFLEKYTLKGEIKSEVELNKLKSNLFSKKYGYFLMPNSTGFSILTLKEMKNSKEKKVVAGLKDIIDHEIKVGMKVAGTILEI